MLSSPTHREVPHTSARAVMHTHGTSAPPGHPLIGRPRRTTERSHHGKRPDAAAHSPAFARIVLGGCPLIGSGT